MIIDTHCHYNLEPFFADWRTYWQKAQTHGVTKSLIIGVDLPTSQRALQLSAENPDFRAAVGIHPTEVQELVEKFPELELPELVTKFEVLFAEIRTLVLSKPTGLIAIGETGLDFFRLPENQQLHHKIRQLQYYAFLQHITLATDHNLVLIAHVRDRETPEQPTDQNAYWETLKLIRQYGDANHPFILHCVSGPVAYARQALDMGAYLGVAGNVTYTNADKIRDLVRIAPKDRLLSETDAPYLPPQEFRGQPCEPWMIAKTVEFLESEMGVTTEQLQQNAQRLLFQ